MAKRKFSDAVALLQDFKNSLEELRDGLSRSLQEMELSRLGEQACQSAIVDPLDSLLADTEVFVTDLENGIYEEDEGFDTSLEDWL